MASTPHQRHDNRDDINKLVVWLFGLTVLGGAVFLFLVRTPIRL